MTREEAIKVLQRMKYPYKCNKRKMIISNVDRDNEALNMAIKALSQEPCRYWLNGKCNGNTEVCEDMFSRDDAISREAVLSIIDGWYEQNRETENIEDLIILITYMDSVTPKSRECEDVISRAEVKRIVDFYKEQYDGIYHINESIDNLPSVTQKSGKWILLDECANSGYYCSNCQKKLVKEGWSNTVKKIIFCPNCGAKMESEDKE